jgi:hypothetical protein
MGYRAILEKKPWIGWAVAGVFLVLAVWIYMRRTTSSDPYSPERMTEMVTIKFTDTGDEVDMPRGRLDKELRQSGGKLDPTKGVVNPKTGQPTGFPFNKAEWNEWITRINTEREAAAKSGPAKTSRPDKVVREAPKVDLTTETPQAEPKK